MCSNTDISAPQDTTHLLIINALMVRISIYSLRIAKVASFKCSVAYTFTYAYIRLLITLSSLHLLNSILLQGLFKFHRPMSLHSQIMI